MKQEIRCGGVTKNPVGILKVAKSDTGQRSNFVSTGKQKVLNVAKKIIPGRNTNVLQVQTKHTKKAIIQETVLKTPEEVKKPRPVAPPSLYDNDGFLSVAPKPEDEK